MAKKKSRLIGDVVDELHAVREEIRALNDEVNDRKQEKAKLEIEFIELCKEQGVESVRGHLATATVKLRQVPHVTDWTKLHKYILQHKSLELLEKRPSVTAWREAVELRKGRPLPGVEAFEKEEVNLLSR